MEMQAMLMAEFANTINEQTKKQFKEMMEAFTKALGNKNSPNPPANPTGGKKKKCPHCLLEVYHNLSIPFWASQLSTTIEFWYSIPTIIILIGIQSGHNYCRNTVGL
jgi:hypothetical protein